MTARIAIIGSGMAGLGAARSFAEAGLSAVIYEKNDHAGGHTASWRNRHGFVFDEGPHISFTKVDRFKTLLAESAGGNCLDGKALFNNYWHGKWIKHPAQCNLHGLPHDLVARVICDFVEARQTGPGDIRNYADWLVASYGETFARTFPMEYGLRYHTTTADNMSTDWLGPRLYRPNLEEVIRGALTPETEDVHYITDFRYPESGGFASFLQGFIDGADILLNHEVVSIDTGSKTIAFAGGRAAAYDHIVSSMPLPRLIAMLENVPEDVRNAAGRLACSSVMIVNIGLDREDISPAHVSYFYDRDFIFTRLSFPHMFSRGNAPDGMGSIQAEIYFSDKYRPLDRSADACIEQTIHDLRRCGLLRESDRIVCSEAKYIPYANIIFDLDRAAAVGLVKDYLDEIGIHTCGRYGEWGYYWTDDSFISGERAARKVVDAIL